CSSNAGSDDPLPMSIGNVADELIGGDVADEADYPSTVRLWSGCTATKVGPRHFLTAGHCALDGLGNLNDAYQSGATFWLTDHNNPPPYTPPYESYTVQQTHVHPAWVQTCQDYLAQYPGGECEAMVLQPGHAPDVALVVVAELSPHIPAAAVDLNPVAVNDSLRVFGYGCEQPGGGGGNLLKTEALPALSVDALDHT